MATRVRPQPAPSTPAPEFLEPGSAMLLVPPTNLTKRLTAAVHRSLPGWTVQVLVKHWADDGVSVVLKGTRDPDSAAPPAPPTDSPQARKIESRTASVLERIVEAQHAGAGWSASARFTQHGVNHFDDIVVAKPNDPPTCIDGKVIFPGEAYLDGKKDVVVVPYEEKKASLGSDPRLRSVYFLCWGSTTGTPSLPGTNLHLYTSPPDPPAPTLMLANAAISLPAGRVFVHVMSAQDPPLVLQARALADWWVWW